MSDTASPLAIAVQLLSYAAQTGDPRYATQVITLLKSGTASDQYPDAEATYWTVLGMAYHIRFERAGDIAALRESVAAFRTVAEGIRRSDQRWPATASNLANILVDVYAVSQSEQALDEAVSLLRAARTAMPADDPSMSACLLNLGRALIELAQARDDSGAYQEAVAVLREAVAASGGADVPAALSNLGNALAKRWEQVGVRSDLDEAITMFGNALALTPAGSPDRYVYLTNMGNTLTDLFEVTGDLSALDRAITAQREAVAALPSGAADTARCLGNLGRSLVRRRERTGDAGALAEAVRVLRESAALTPRESASRAPRLLNLGTALGTLFSSSGRLEDLKEAVAALREALATLPSRHAERATVLAALGEALTRSFELTGDVAALDEALLLLREAVSSTEPGHAAFGLRLFNLAGALMRRFEQVRHRATLDEAIEVARRAVEVTPAGHPSLAVRLSGLGSALNARHIHDGSGQDLTDAIAAHRRAVAASEDDPQRVIRLSNLGIALLRAYAATHDRAFLDEAVPSLRAAVEQAGDNDPNLGGFWSNLANALRQRVELDGTDSDDEAVGLLRLAAQAAPPGHPNLAAYQFNLGAVYRARYQRGGNLADATAAADAFLAGAAVQSASSMVRASAAASAGRIAAAAGLASRADEGFDAAVGLLDRLAWRGLPRTDQEDLLKRFAGLAQDATAWALERGDLERAVELAEQGRGVLLAQAVDARAPRTLLHDAEPDFADHLARLDLAIDRIDASAAGGDSVVPTDNMPSRSAAEQRMALAAERDALLREIAAAGLADFIASARFGDLRRAASDGPVVIISISRYRCDALTLTRSGLRHTRLDTTAEEVERQVIAFVTALEDPGSPTATGSGRDPVDAVLSWLYAKVAGPVLRDLGLARPQPPHAAPRLWWCPTGLLSFLPLHAARPEEAGSPGVLDLVASSYTPTLRTLLHARSRPDALVTAPAPRTLVVSVPETPGYPPLPGAAREAAAIRRRVPHAEVMSGPDATTAAVTGTLDSVDWIHFVCHGEQDLSSPSDGRLHLYDGPLTVRQLAQRHARRGRLAVLSGCETIRGSAELADEAITLASAIQLAGFQHVIGTLWAVSDAVAARFADIVYRELARGGTTPGQSAHSVHQALWELRDRYASPRAWAPFVHVGP